MAMSSHAAPSPVATRRSIPLISAVTQADPFFLPRHDLRGFGLGAGTLSFVIFIHLKTQVRSGRSCLFRF